MSQGRTSLIKSPLPFRHTLTPTHFHQSLPIGLVHLHHHQSNTLHDVLTYQLTVQLPYHLLLLYKPCLRPALLPPPLPVRLHFSAQTPAPLLHLPYYSFNQLCLVAMRCLPSGLAWHHHHQRNTPGDELQYSHHLLLPNPPRPLLPLPLSEYPVLVCRHPRSTPLPSSHLHLTPHLPNLSNSLH